MAGPAALLAAAVAGLAWGTSFAVLELIPLVVAVLVPVLVVDQVTFGRPRLAVARPLLGLLLGAAALVAVLVVGGATAGEVVEGLVFGFQRTLESTLPAYPDAEQVAFVPALTLVAGVLGVEWTRHVTAPLVVLLPSFVVLVLAQGFRAAQGWAAVAVAVGYGMAAAAMLAVGRRAPTRATGTGIWRRTLRTGAVVVPALLVVAMAGVAAWATTSTDPVSMQDARRVAERADPVADPLSQIGERLLGGDRVAFRVSTTAAVDRWPLVVLDGFDGVDWTSTGEVRILGAGLPEPALAVPAATADAEISGLALDGPWLPSQPRLRAVDGLRALVSPATGVLLLPDDTPAPASYRLRWTDPRIDRDQLTGATIDPDPVGAVALDAVPAGISDLARSAVGPDVGPSVQAALVLERWMRDTYTVAEGADIPTGHGYPQLLHFLTTAERGTSEQFATAYAVLARSIGIPTRVVVGFRYDGSGTVRDADALAWPEIAVSGLGWVPLDPTGGARTGGGTGESLAEATEAARSELPAAGEPARQTVPAPAPVAVPATPLGVSWWVWPVVAVLLLVVVVPLSKLLRRVRRRHRPPAESVLGAWREVRDALRDQGVPVPPGATVRDLVPRAPVDPAALDELARCVDTVLWSGASASPAAAGTAWTSARRVRRELRGRSVRGRLRAGYAVTSFRRPRQPSQTAPRRD